MKDFEYDISHLVHAFTVVIFFTAVVPFTLYVLLRFLGTRIALVQLVCLYGYSLVPFGIASLLCLIPLLFWEWLILFVASLMSCLLILRNIAGPIIGSGMSQQKSGAVLIFILACHFIFFLVLKLTFYHHSKKQR